jgi:predicted enzyme related to lactoylglutathione lyase
MASDLSTVVYPVKHAEPAKRVYTALLGVEPYMDEPYYVGFRLGEQELGLDPNGHARGLTGPTCYWEVDDIEASLERLVAAGAEVDQPVTDVGGGKRIASVKDADGNVTGIAQSP